MSIKGYEKLAVAVVGVVVTGLNVLYGTNPDVQLAVAVLTAAGVYTVPNSPRV